MKWGNNLLNVTVDIKHEIGKYTYLHAIVKTDIKDKMGKHLV